METFCLSSSFWLSSALKDLDLNIHRFIENKSMELANCIEVVRKYDTNFDWSLYLSLFSDLRKAGLKTREDACRHYWHYGRFESQRMFIYNQHRLPNQTSSNANRDKEASLYKICFRRGCPHPAQLQYSTPSQGMYFCSSDCQTHINFPIKCTGLDKVTKFSLSANGKEYDTVYFKEILTSPSNYSLDYQKDEVTVICNYYQRIETIPAHLNQILNQTKKPKEIWICLFGSPYESQILETIRSIIFDIPIHFFLSSYNLKYHGRFSIGMYAKTEFVYFIDDDVFIYPRYIEDALEVLKQENVGEVGTWGFHYYRDLKGEIDWDRMTYIDWDFGVDDEREGMEPIPWRADMLIRHHFLRTRDLSVVFENLASPKYLQTGEDIYLGHMLKFKLNKPPYLMSNRIEDPFFQQKQSEKTVLNEGNIPSSTMGDPFNLFLRRQMLFEMYTKTMNENIETRKYGMFMFGRNDNYGGDNEKRGIICLNAWSEVVDEIVFVDVDSPNKSFIEKLRPSLKNPGKIKNIRIRPDEWSTIRQKGWEPLYQTMSRNIGLRRFSSNVNIIIASNIDIIPPSRQQLDELILTDHAVYVVPRLDVNYDKVVSLYEQYEGNISQIKHHIQDNYGYDADHVFEANSTTPQENLYINQDPIRNGYLLTLNDSWLIKKYGRENVKFLIKMAKVRNLGDFQMATRKSWFHIRGFEEGMTKHFGSDTNLMVKFWNSGLEQIVINEALCYHMSHTCRSGYSVEINDHHKFIFNFNVRTYNNEQWGLPDKKFSEE